MQIDVIERVANRLRGLSQAYPTDLFPPLTIQEIQDHKGVIGRASAGMGRHFQKLFAEMADELEKSLKDSYGP